MSALIVCILLKYSKSRVSNVCENNELQILVTGGTHDATDKLALRTLEVFESFQKKVNVVRLSSPSTAEKVNPKMQSRILERLTMAEIAARLQFRSIAQDSYCTDDSKSTVVLS